jgi:Lrp/AsnC family transcriptional regulator, leucine-responsive regulatory protein
MPAQPTVDDIDRAILDLLREDARRTVTDIATRVSLTAAPVKRRIERLERLGIIEGYTVVVDDRRLGPSLEAFTELRVAGGADVEDVMSVTTLPEVREAFTIAGDPDVLLRLRVDDMAHLQRVINDLRRTGRFTGTKTLMVLRRWIDTAA